MLVLSRHRDESVIIGDDITITVVDIRGDKVRLGIAAPIEISVHRQEVYEAILREIRNGDIEPTNSERIGLGPIRSRVRPASSDELVSAARAMIAQSLMAEAPGSPSTGNAIGRLDRAILDFERSRR